MPFRIYKRGVPVMKWLKRGIVVLLIVSIPIALYVMFSPRHIVRDFIALSGDGELYTMSLDLTVQRRLTVVRTRSIRHIVTGSITIGDTKLIRTDTELVPRDQNVFTFLPYGLDLTGVVWWNTDNFHRYGAYFSTVRFDSAQFNVVSVNVALGRCEYDGRIIVKPFWTIDGVQLIQ